MKAELLTCKMQGAFPKGGILGESQLALNNTVLNIQFTTVEIYNDIFIINLESLVNVTMQLSVN